MAYKEAWPVQVKENKLAEATSEEAQTLGLLGKGLKGIILNMLK